MSNIPSPTPPSDTATPAVAAGPAPVAATPSSRRPGQGLLWLALLLAAIALVFTGMLWQKFGLMQQELARRAQESNAQAVEARTLAAQAEALAQEGAVPAVPLDCSSTENEHWTDAGPMSDSDAPM